MYFNNMIPLIDTHLHLIYREQASYSWTKEINEIANSDFSIEDYKKLTLETDLVFHDSPKSDMIQFVYSYYIDPNYKWEPIRAVIWHKHNGIIDNVAEVL